MQRSFQPVMTTIVLTAAMLLACVPASASVLTLNDNMTHDLNSAVGGDVYVYNSTTANLLTGGEISGGLEADDTSTVNVSGGSIGDDLEAWTNSMVNVSGGTIGDDLWAYHNSTVTVSGGTIGDDLAAYNNSEMTVSGGSIEYDLWANDNSTVTVSGGSIGGYLAAYSNSTVTIFGTFDIFGYGIYADGDLLDEATLTGTLADGTAFNNQVYIYQSATVTLAAPATAVPEPSSIAMFGIGALGLFGYGRRRRQTSAAA